jgi:shikimate 5-dehydrogenase
MLLHQACIAWKLWFDVEPVVTSALRKYIEATL